MVGESPDILEKRSDRKGRLLARAYPRVLCSSHGARGMYYHVFQVGAPVPQEGSLN
jgi:hypothetical protein